MITTEAEAYGAILARGRRDGSTRRGATEESDKAGTAARTTTTTICVVGTRGTCVGGSAGATRSTGATDSTLTGLNGGGIGARGTGTSHATTRTTTTTEREDDAAAGECRGVDSDRAAGTSSTKTPVTPGRPNADISPSFAMLRTVAPSHVHTAKR